MIRSRTDKQLPVGVIECNYTPGNGYRPPHLNINTFEKLFQELGSAVHNMLSKFGFKVGVVLNYNTDLHRFTKLFVVWW